MKTKNTFENCREPVVYIQPQNSEDAYVHHHIKITENIFICDDDTLVLSAKGVENFSY